MALRDLATPNPAIYWADFLISIFVGYACANFYFTLPGLSVLRVACYVVAVLLIFRASSFVHELVHLRQNNLRSFAVAWDLLCGIPLLFPSFAYSHHLDHHRCDSYGTDGDGEYLPFGVDPPRTIGYFLLLTFIWPLMVVFRFLILTPASFLYPPFRPWLLTRFSSFGIANFQHRLAITPSTPLKYWAFLDLACFARTLAPALLVATGAMEWTRLPMLYSMAAGVLTLNFIRALCLHNYLHEGETVSYLGQLQDSITLPGNAPIAELFVPLGLRYHALHHLFPHLPYHALGRAHRRLMNTLPPNSDYHRTVRSGIAAVFMQLWKNTWAPKPAAQPEAKAAA
ncbi:MAG: fatty acid desaturase [Pirellulales bacterium]